MKKQILLFVLVFPLFSIAQDHEEGIIINAKDIPASAQVAKKTKIGVLFQSAGKATTEEEYLYCTKGYKSQIEKGLDAQKNGYRFENAGSYYGGNLEFVKMIDENSSVVKATIIITKVSNTAVNYCMPNKYSSAEMRERWNSTLSKMWAPRRNMIMVAFSDMIMNMEKE